ncbi:AT-hook motif nuclear-localized protein 5-like [Vicia villosa]|uniref:AT-hook motif nuclear-localized protein 5-like n=1 Tax=Vicia villosa TaxID=3911 RepID=UPI00273BCA9B|nr:AT-hook motif nuclear-localized protein 5-like [Vicia villosa]XP_058732003.1 AT-hook motif nuclear-localized protein 5-like [Vicia villosa]
MDGREAMAFPGGPGSYYMHRGGVEAAGSGSGGFQVPPGFRALPNNGIIGQQNVRAQGGNGDTSSMFSSEPQSQADFNHDVSVGASSGVPLTEPVKKKRGRPRKYGPDGSVSLKLTPMSAPANSTQDLGTPSEKRGRGRPRGSGRKQQLAALGDWMTSSAGLAFSPHVITIAAGEDIAAKLLSLSQQRPRALCILSGTGIASQVTLRQPASTNAGVTYEGKFQILSLSGSYLVAEEGGPTNRTGGISVSLSSRDGHVIGGSVAVLIAGSPVQLVVCSFVYGGGSKVKTKQGTVTNGESSEPHNDNLGSPASAPPGQNYISSPTSMWPGSQPSDLKSVPAHTGIDLTRG